MRLASVIVKAVRELTPQEYAACHRLNLRERGTMQGALAQAQYNKRPAYVHMVWEGEMLAGWALQTQNRDRAWMLQIYVRVSRRRQGIGTRLIESAKRHSNKRRINVAYHTGEAASFFQSVRLGVRR